MARTTLRTGDGWHLHQLWYPDVNAWSAECCCGRLRVRASCAHAQMDESSRNTLARTRLSGFLIFITVSSWLSDKGLAWRLGSSSLELSRHIAWTAAHLHWKGADVVLDVHKSFLHSVEGQERLHCQRRRKQKSKLCSVCWLRLQRWAFAPPLPLPHSICIEQGRYSYLCLFLFFVSCLSDPLTNENVCSRDWGGGATISSFFSKLVFPGRKFLRSLIWDVCEAKISPQLNFLCICWIPPYLSTFLLLLCLPTVFFYYISENFTCAEGEVSEKLSLFLDC